VSDGKNQPGPEWEREIERLKAKAIVLGGGVMACFEDESASSPFRRMFWEQVIAIESAAQTTRFERLEQAGVTLPDPEKMEEDELCLKLREVILGLSRLQVYLRSTDHLSDRELYTRLWASALREPAYPVIPDSATIIDLVASDSERDTTDYLMYYADDLARSMWENQWPDQSLPERESPPFDRDRFLPKPPFVRWMDAPSPAVVRGGRGNRKG
jgi:hypothetical protein